MRVGGTMVAMSGLALVTSLAASHADAQPFRVGETVEASPMMMNSNWESCTVIALHPGGDVGVACGPRRTEYVVQSRWVRPGGGRRTAPATPQPGSRQSAPVAASPGGLCPDAPRGMVGRRQQENGVCRLGARVTDREGRTGTVIDAPDRASCRVCLSDGTHRYYLTWMLSAGGRLPARAGGRTASGNYQCYGGAAGNMRITITDGRWQGYYAETLPDGRVGISSQPNGRPYYMICERR